MKLTKFTAGANLPARWGRKGFTLVEIMIVVLIIGILLAIAVPNFIKARETSRCKGCVANLKQIEAAKEQWCMDNKQAASATPAATDLRSEERRVGKARSCPSTGTYTIGDMSTRPVGSTGTGATPSHVVP